MTSWHNYGKIYSLGHAAIKNLLDGPVTVEEKIDGSQFSFGVFDGQIRCRSKGKDQHDAPDNLFSSAVATVRELAPILHEGWTYRGEVLQKPKHNVLAYSRTPAKNIILYDIATDEEQYLNYEKKDIEAQRVGLEVVPLIYCDPTSPADIRRILELESCLGGPKIEGIVIKRYGIFGTDGKTLMGKYVSEEFKEAHKTHWDTVNPKSANIADALATAYRSEARWAKAVQHLAEVGKLLGTPADIGPLVKEAQRDVADECAAEIKEILWKWWWPLMQRQITKGLPEWYKNRLMESQFGGKPNA